MGRKKALFVKNAIEPFKLSRSKLELFMNCPRCFYIDRKLGISPPSMPPFNLNLAVDALFKKEFDIYRAKKQPHPIMKSAGLDAVPLESPLLEKWRDYHSGMQYYIKDINIIVYGAIDDILFNFNGEYIVIDYKATSSEKVVDLKDEWKKAYKRQVEIYQWLLKMNGYKVSNIAYFVYANALKTPESFDNKLTFSTTLLPYEGDCSWVGEKVRDAHACLFSDFIPPVNKNCNMCDFIEKIKKI